MPYVVPVAKNYASPLQAIPSRVLDTPKEGPKSIPCEIIWSTMASATPNFAVDINFANNATLEFSQICALKVDNSQCGSDIVFIFSDTNDTLTVPAYFPATVFPIFSNRQQFVVKALGPKVLTTDVTRFNVLNFLPPPVTMPTTQAQFTAASNNILFDGATNTQVIATTVNGTLEAIQLSVANLGAAEDFKYTLTLTDGAGAVMPSVQVSVKSGNPLQAIVLDMSPVNLRFSAGVLLNQARITGTMSEGAVSANLLYRTP